MSALRQSEPGWLGRAISSAKRRLYLRFTPHDLMRRGQSVTLPISGPEADDLYADLDAQYFAWTGRHLSQHRTPTQQKDRSNGAR